MISDEQFVQRVRRWQPWHRSVGVAMLLIGIAVVGLGLYRVFHLRAEALVMLDQFRDGRQPTTRDTKEVMATLEFSSGMLLGLVLGGALAGGGVLIGSGLSTFMGSRRDRLLLQLWEGRAHGRS